MTINACAETIAAIGALDRKLARLQSELDEQVAKAKADYEAKAGPLRDDRETAEAQVRAFCEARRDSLCEGDSKSIEFATGEAGWRMGQAKLEVESKRLPEILKALMVPKLKHLLRFRDPEIDKRAVLKQPELVKGLKGLKIVPAEESFWVKPTALDLAEGPGTRADVVPLKAASGR
jgi:phage host-nuclease inhibitor protein Gam